MSTGIYKMYCDQGATYNLVLVWRNPDQSEIDLTGYTAVMRVAPNKGADLVLNPTTENGQIVLGGDLGTIMIDIPAEITAEVEQGQYVYELDLISGDGVVTRLVEGPFYVDGQV